MYTRQLFSQSFLVALLLVCGRALAAGVNTNDPSLPVLYPTGTYLSPAQVHATYSGTGLTLVLSQIEHRAFGPVDRHPITTGSPNETELFSSQMFGLISANGGSAVSAQGSGPVQTEVFGKVGNVTGTFNTEMLSLSLNGTSPLGPFMIRESPTLASVGQTTISDLGGGQYHIDSFFDVFTELSLDGGATWMPDTTGPARVNLTTPEPAILPALSILTAGLLRLRRRR